jgi:hypothetical protein
LEKMTPTTVSAVSGCRATGAVFAGQRVMAGDTILLAAVFRQPHLQTDHSVFIHRCSDTPARLTNENGFALMSTAELQQSGSFRLPDGVTRQCSRQTVTTTA